MKKGLRIVIVFLVLLLIVAGLYFYLNPKKALNIIIPEISQVENIHVVFRGDTADIDVDLRMENKSMFKLNIDSLSYAVNFDSTLLLSKEQDLAIELKPSQTDTFILPIALPFRKLSKQIKSIQDRDSVEIQIDVKVVYATVFGRTALPYSKTITIAVPRPPKIEVEKMEYISRKKKTVELMAHVIIHNYGKIDLHISDMKYHMVVKDLFDAKGNEKKEIHIRPASNISVKLPITVEFKNILKTVGKIITNNDKVNYHLVVTAMIQNDKVGDKKTPLEIVKDGTVELKK